MKNNIVAPRNTRKVMQNFKIMGLPSTDTPELGSSFVFKERMTDDYMGSVTSHFCIDENNTRGADEDHLWGKSTNPSNPSEILFEDPNLEGIRTLTAIDPGYQEIKESCFFELDDPTEEDIAKAAKQNILNDFRSCIQLDDIDSLTIGINELDLKLKQLGNIKEENFSSAISSLSSAEKIIQQERFSVMDNIIQSLILWSSTNNSDFYILSPCSRKSYMGSLDKLEAARTLILESSGAPTKSKGIESRIKDLVIDAVTLWPHLQQNPKLNHLLNII